MPATIASGRVVQIVRKLCLQVGRLQLCNDLPTPHVIAFLHVDLDRRLLQVTRQGDTLRGRDESCERQ